MAAAALAVVGAPKLAHAASPPDMTFFPSSYDYGTVNPSPATPPSQTFILANTGGRATGAIDVTLSSTGGAANAYAITADTCTGTSLGPDKKAPKMCGVTVQYDPTVADGTDSATLTATSRRADTTSVALTGVSQTTGLPIVPITLSLDSSTGGWSGTADTTAPTSLEAFATVQFFVTNPNPAPVNVTTISLVSVTTSSSGPNPAWPSCPDLIAAYPNQFSMPTVTENVVVPADTARYGPLTATGTLSWNDVGPNVIQNNCAGVPLTVTVQTP